MSATQKQTITLDLLMDGVEYPPKPGTEYEVGAGKRVKLMPPTVGNIRRFNEKVAELKGKEGSDLELAKIITEGEWPEEEDIITPVASAIAQDFIEAAFWISRRLQEFSATSKSPAEK